jgi:hypothetical protein
MNRAKKQKNVVRQPYHHYGNAVKQIKILNGEIRGTLEAAGLELSHKTPIYFLSCKESG